MKEQQYNNSVKYQRMVEYELNNPGETATVSLDRCFSAPSIEVWANLTEDGYRRERLSTRQSLRGQGGGGSSGSY